MACSERVQSKVDSANDVADSNVGVNGNDSNNAINSNDEDDDSFDSKGGDFGEPNNGNSDDGQHSNASDMAIYVNPQMETNSIWKRGFPVWEYPSLPAHFRIGTPHMEMGNVVVATSKSCIDRASSPKFWQGN